MMGSLLGAMSALQKAPPVVQKLLESLMSQLSEHPDVIAEVSTAIEKLAAAKEMDIPTLISSGGLVRALMERASGKPISPEKKVNQLNALVCAHCGETNYILEKQYVRKERTGENQQGD